MKKSLLIVCLIIFALLVFDLNMYIVKAYEYNKFGFTQEEAEGILKDSTTDCLYTDFEDSYYNHGENIEIQFEIRNSKDSEKRNEYTVVVESNDISLGKEKYATVNQYFTINFTSIKTGEFEIQIIAFDNENNYFESTIYIYATKDLDFVSKISISQARSLYFLYLFNKNEVNQEDYNYIVYNDVRYTDITKFAEKAPTTEEFKESTIKSSNIIYIYGYIKFEDYNFDEYPAKNVKINLYDEDIFGLRQTLGITYTSSSGFYLFTIENDLSFFENGYDIILEIKLGNEYYQVQDSFQVYEKEYGTFANVTQTYTRIDHVFEYTEDGFGIPANLYEAATIGFDYIELVDSDDIENYALLGIEYPYNNGTSCWYSPITADIYMGSSGINVFMWDNFLHEFGHYVAHQNGITNFWPAEHSLEQNLFVVFGKDIGMRLAWSEGWANYFSVMVQQVMYNSLPRIPNTGDTFFRTYNMETVNDSSYLMGEGNEYIIALLLFDIADLNDDGLDNIDWGHEVLFNYLENYVENMRISDPYYTIVPFKDFYNSLELNAYDTEFGPLMTYYKISAALTSPTITSYNPPEFSWEAQGGEYNINNDFTLYIMDSSGNLLLDPIWVGNATEKDLALEQWTTILSSGVSSIVWNVSSMQTTGTDTGPYFSERKQCSLPNPYPLYIFQTRFGSLPNSGSYVWYKFTATLNMYYTFESSGYTDTYVEFFNNPVAGTSTDGRLYYDNDSGSGLNFSKTIYMNSYQTVYLRIRGDEWAETGTYNIDVTPGY